MKKDVYGLSKPQESIWLTEQYFKNTNINHIIASVDFSSKVDNLDFNLLNKAVNEMIRLNDTFQLRFFLEDGVLKQYLCDFTEKQLPFVEISSIQDFMNEETNRKNFFHVDKRYSSL